MIYEQITQRRGAREFISTKPYVKLVATLATEQPGEDVAIPAFNPKDIFGNSAPISRKDQTGGELTSDPRVYATLIDVAGGFLPREDHQELSDEEAERIVAEADAISPKATPAISGASQPEGRFEGRATTRAGRKKHNGAL